MPSGLATLILKDYSTVKVLLTGFAGFAGSHYRQRYSCVPLEDKSGNLIDILDLPGLTESLASIQPDAVVHLAGQAFVPESFRDPYHTYQINFTGTLNLLTALEGTGFKGRVVLAGSAEVYGRVVPEELPISEGRAVDPRSPYAVSKAAIEMLALQWVRHSNFEVINTRPFNHVGPGQHEGFAISNFSKQLAQIRLSRQKPVIQVGDIDVTRDFTDVRDVVAAYKALLSQGENSEIYNISSGTELSIRWLLDKLIEIADIEVQVEQDSARMRVSDQRRMAGSYDKLHRDTGWSPEIPIEQTLRDTLDYWLEALSKK